LIQQHIITTASTQISFTSADLVPGKVGKAIDFDGANDYIKCYTLGTVNSPFTVEALIYFKSS